MMIFCTVGVPTKDRKLKIIFFCEKRHLLGFVKMCVFPEGGISGLGSSGWACYVGEFHPKCSKFGTIVHLGSKS